MTETTLPTTDQWYQAFGDAAPGFLWLTDPSGRILYVNRTWEQYTGSSLEEINELGRAHFNHPDEAATVQQRWGRALELEQPFETELRYRRHDGVYRWMLARVVPLRDSEGGLQNWVGTSVDIDDLKQAATELRRREQELTDFFENAAVPMHWVGPDGTIVRVNQAELDLLGYDRDEFQGKNIVDFHVDREVIDDILRRLLAGEVLHDYPARLRSKNGSTRHVLIDSSGYFENGRFVHTRCFTRDVTERKDAAEALSQSQERLRLALKAARMGTWQWDVASNTLTWDEQLHELYGIEPGQQVTQYEHFIGRVHQDDRAFVAASVQRALEDGGGLDYEFRIVLPDGRVRWLVDQGRLIRDQRGHPLYMTGVCLDATDRKLIEERLRQAQRMDSVGQLAGGIAHEANNMMSVVLGCADYVLQRTDLPGPVREDVDQIWKAAKRTAGITQQLLAFSRRQVLQPQVLDLNATVRDLEAILSRTLGETRGLRMHLSPGLSPVRADPGQLEQVLVNLTLNARDAMRDQGRLTIETMSVVLDEAYAAGKSVDSLRPGEYAALVVSDTGHGMERATLERVFEPFFTTKGVGQGTGLGLSTVYGIVKQSGGFIWVYSEPGLGTTFKLYFPVVTTSPGATDLREPPPAARKNETVLVAEDEPMVRGIMARTLRDCGYNVLEAADGRAALDILEAEAGQVSLIVADVVMPDLGGREMAARLAERWPDVPVLFTSGYTGMDVVRRGLLDEGREFIQKPLAPEELARKVRDMVDAGATKR